MTITLEDLKSFTIRESAHLNLGGGGYGYDYLCDQEPRLRREIRSIKPRGRNPGSNTDHWLVDGHQASSLAEVVERLNAPPREPPPEFAAREKALKELQTRLFNKKT